MAKRCFDVVCAATALVLLAPLLLMLWLAIRLSTPGPAVVRLRRMGRNRELFTMHKFRTMHIDQGPNPSPLTCPDDPRVFPLGALLRRLKLDELPQLYDVLRGRMSLVGPRPEDPLFVWAHYPAGDLEILRVRPGLTSPATLYDYTHGDRILAGGDAEQRYVAELLPAKLALDRWYLRESSLVYDLRLILRTAGVVVRVGVGQREFAEPPELERVRGRHGAAGEQGRNHATGVTPKEKTR